MQQLDSNVQVALVSVFATFITTLGVIAVAVINNRKERAKAAGAGVEAALDEKDILRRMLSLIAENDEKDAEIRDLEEEIKELKAVIRQLKTDTVLVQLDETTKEDSDAKLSKPD